MSNILYAYDPGGKTGWAKFSTDANTRTALALACGEMPLWELLDAQIPSPFVYHVVYENIVARSLDFNPIGIQVIGVIRYLCQLHDMPVSHQSNAMLRGIEKWGQSEYNFKPIRSPHALDALMHGIVYLRKAAYTVEVDTSTCEVL